MPLSVVGTPERFSVLLMGQEGYPSEGNWRVRDVTEFGAQWRFGGGSNQPGEPDVIDMLVPPGKSQAKILGAYDLAAKKLAAIPMVTLSSRRPAPAALALYLIAGLLLLVPGFRLILKRRFR